MKSLKKINRDEILFLNSKKHVVEKILESEINNRKSIKITLLLYCILVKQNFDDKDVQTSHKMKDEPKSQLNEIEQIVFFEGWIHSSSFQNAQEIYNKYDISKNVKKLFKKLKKEYDKFTAKGSGLKLKEIKYLQVNSIKFKPFKGASYIDLPPRIKNSKACINVKNEDNKCFLWSVLSCIHHKDIDDHHSRVAKYEPYENELNMKGIEYPVSINGIKKFEKLNNKKIIVFQSDEKGYITPLYNDKTNKNEQVIDLLYIQKGDKTHYVWIKNFEKLMSKEKNNNEYHYCKNCLSKFTSKEILEKHYCDDNEAARVRMPQKGKETLEFKNIKKQLPAPFVIYADFEAILKNHKEEVGSGTEIYQKHECMSYGYKITSIYDNLPNHVCNNLQEKLKYKSFTATKSNEDVIGKFLKSLNEDAKWINDIVLGEEKEGKWRKQLIGNKKKWIRDDLKGITIRKGRNENMIISEKEIQEFKKAKDCHICGNELKNDRVKDHDHITGKYRGPAHEQCNIQYHMTRNYRIPVIFHNLKGYDSHFIIQELGKYSKNIDVIPNTMEKYISFNSDYFEFKDSLQFMASSLDELVGNLGFDEMKLLQKNFQI